MSCRLVPVVRKKVPKVLISTSSTVAVMPMMSSESMARSVTTVPRALANDTPS